MSLLGLQVAEALQAAQDQITAAARMHLMDMSGEALRCRLLAGQVANSLLRSVHGQGRLRARSAVHDTLSPPVAQVLTSRLTAAWPGP